MASQNLLDLDVSKSIKYLENSIDTKYLKDTINKLIKLIKFFGKNIGSVYHDIEKTHQYKLQIKYLNHILPIFFEFDYTYQFINILYYNSDQTKIYLKLYLSINDDPTIKYIENDHSGNIPSYHNNNINLKPGEYLINFSHCLLSYIGFERTRLDDDSYLITINSQGNEIRTKLWLYYLLKYGKSWYSKFGYEPANINAHEYNMYIADVGNIKLDKISSCLNKVLSAPNVNYFDPLLVDISQKIIELIGCSEKNIYEYTKNHSLEDFTNLTNNLSQSIFSREISIQINNDNSSDNKGNKPQYYNLDFFWFQKYKKLLIGNVMQINNNIKKYFLQLPE